MMSHRSWQTALTGTSDRWKHDSYLLLYTASKLQEILPINQIPQVVVALKDDLSKSKRDSSYRYEACYSLIWHCAQNMPYLDFFAAWQQS